MAKNPVFQNRTKHIAIKYHFLREVEANRERALKYCKFEEQQADIFTNALPWPRFELPREMISVPEMFFKEECWDVKNIPESAGILRHEVFDSYILWWSKN